MEKNYRPKNLGNLYFWTGLLALAIGAIGVWTTVKDYGNYSFNNNDIVKNKAIARIAFSISGEMFKTLGGIRT